MNRPCCFELIYLGTVMRIRGIVSRDWYFVRHIKTNTPFWVCASAVFEMFRLPCLLTTNLLIEKIFQKPVLEAQSIDFKQENKKRKPPVKLENTFRKPLVSCKFRRFFFPRPIRSELTLKKPVRWGREDYEECL